MEEPVNYKRLYELSVIEKENIMKENQKHLEKICLLYTSPSPRDRTRSRMPSSA